MADAGDGDPSASLLHRAGEIARRGRPKAGSTLRASTTSSRRWSASFGSGRARVVVRRPGRAPDRDGETHRRAGHRNPHRRLSRSLCLNRRIRGSATNSISSVRRRRYAAVEGLEVHAGHGLTSQRATRRRDSAARRIEYRPFPRRRSSIHGSCRERQGNEEADGRRANRRASIEVKMSPSSATPSLPTSGRSLRHLDDQGNPLRDRSDRSLFRRRRVRKTVAAAAHSRADRRRT